MKILGSSWLMMGDLVGMLVEEVIPHTEVVEVFDGRYIGWKSS